MSDDQDFLELGKFYFLNKKFKKAVEVFKEILGKEKNNYDAMYNLALSYEALNDLDQAKNIYQKLLSIKAEHKLAKDHLSKIIGKE